MRTRFDEIQIAVPITFSTYHLFFTSSSISPISSSSSCVVCFSSVSGLPGCATVPPVDPVFPACLPNAASLCRPSEDRSISCPRCPSGRIHDCPPPIPSSPRAAWEFIYKSEKYDANSKFREKFLRRQKIDWIDELIPDEHMFFFTCYCKSMTLRVFFCFFEDLEMDRLTIDTQKETRIF